MVMGEEGLVWWHQHLKVIEWLEGFNQVSNSLGFGICHQVKAMKGKGW